MSLRISELHGVDAKLGAKLKDQGLDDSDKLLSAAATPQQRKELAAKTGASEKEILTLANRADLARIKGVGKVYSDLLELAGVDTVVELARRNPDNLCAKVSELGPQHGVDRIPRLDEIKDWIEQAKNLDRAMSY